MVLPVQRRIRSFVLRGGRMTEGQRRAFDLYWPQYGADIEAMQGDLAALFPQPGKLVVEIGFGMGDSLVSMAENSPEQNFVGIEVHRPGVGRLLAGVAEKALTNLKVFNDDAIEVLQRKVEDSSVDRLQIFFPDPWHKKKHHKRRLIQESFLNLVAAKLKDDGVLHIATDWENYAEQVVEKLQQHAAFQNAVKNGVYAEKPHYRPKTKFERRGERLGHGVWDIIFVKRP